MINKVFLLAFAILFVASPFFRCLVTNIHNSVYYAVRDIYEYFKYGKYKQFNEYGIDCYCGMFGHGKTLSMIHRVTSLYNRYDHLRVISNIHLNNIPYIPLTNFQQLVDIGLDEDEDYNGTIIVIDEISSVLSHRNFSKFPIALIGLLMQQRKKKCYIVCTAQRFGQVDKLWRDITTNVIDCNKRWRFQNLKYYDAWDYENSLNREILKAFLNRWWFVRNKDYSAYDTSEMINAQKASDFISNDETIQRIGMSASVVSPEAVPERHKKKAYRTRSGRK